MTDKYLSTDAYKGVRDFYPETMAEQQHIFDTWSQTAESFGFVRYDASVLEPADLYKSKGAENEELVNEQTYTFLDRGEREVTLRPEMTPTVARLVAQKRRELTFPIRWYSIPNLFRYERPQRGRLREHWQLNCDIFGDTDYTAEVEIIALAYQVFMNFGADASMFEICINDRTEMREKYAALGITDLVTQDSITRLNDRFHKLSTAEYQSALAGVLNDEALVKPVYALVAGHDQNDANAVVNGLKALGITNVKIDRSIARGFNYYTGTVFEIFDTNSDNRRSILGGGRYDNLTSMFGEEVIAGVGFGMGDVTMHDFLTGHQLLQTSPLAPTVVVVPVEANLNLEGQKIASQIRQKGFRVATDIGTRKLSKKISTAVEQQVKYLIVVGPDELATNQFVMKDLVNETESTGTIEALIGSLTDLKSS